jgi:hypothetical protein
VLSECGPEPVGPADSPHQRRNGLDADTWVVLIDNGASELVLLLDTLRDADIAAYAVRLDRLGRRRPSSVFRIRVGTWTHSRAEDVIREVLLRHRRSGW